MKTYLVIYPVSGRVMRLHGLFSVSEINGTAPVIEDDSSRVWMIDPRALIMDDDTLEVIYNPRQWLDSMASGLKKVMLKNPDWCRLLSSPARSSSGRVRE